MARIHDSRGERSTARTVALQAVPHLTETLGYGHPDTRRAEQYALPAPPG